jgi:DNA-binding CsgD family transcriptional regulator
MAADFVGRVAELDQLSTLLARAREREPATVLVNGDAGLGKTRLLREFTSLARLSGAFVLVGGCVPLGSVAIPYGPLIEALRAFVRREGERRVRELAGPVWPELAGLIADFTGEDTDRQGSQHRVFLAISRFLDQLCSRAPVVVVLEDLQWTDPSTVDLLAYLTRTRSTERTLLVGSYRSGLAADHPLRGLLAEPEFIRGTHRLTLLPLDEAESWRLFAGLVASDIPRERLARYVELAEGNPYFAEQLALAGVDARVPETLNEIMRLRLARLSEQAMRLARVAAVAGRRVSDGLLAAVLGDGQALDDALRECLDRRVLLLDQEVAETYVFQHALLREAAYATASPRERRRLHAAMAEAITTTPALDRDPRLLPELAHHWFAAGRQREALDAAVRAGALAGALHAFKEADTQYQHALTLWPTVGDAASVAGVGYGRLLFLAADAARWAGRLPQAVDLVRKAIDEADGEDRARRGELYERLGSYLWEAGQVAESSAAYRTADGLLGDGPPTTVSVRVRSALATAEVRAGRYTDALRIAEQAVASARALGARPEEGRALNSVGLASTMLDDQAGGEAALSESLRIATEVGHLEDMLRACGNLGVCLDHAGKLARAVEAMTSGLDKARALGVLHTRQAAVLGNNAGVALFRLGRWDEAAERLADAVVHRPLGESSYPRLTMAEIDVARGRFEAAEDALESLRSQPNTDPRFVASLYCCLAELAGWRGDPDGAGAAVDHGLAAVAGTEDTRARAQLCAVGLRAVDQRGARADELLILAREAGANDGLPGETAALLGQCEAEHHALTCAEPASARDRWLEVAEAWRALERPYPMAYAEYRVATVALLAGDRRAAAEAARSAHALASGLDAAPLLARISGLAKRNRLRLTPTEQRAERPFNLTAQELAVLRAASDGASNRMIGKQLSISDKTVSAHLQNLFKKLDVHSRTEAIAKARRHGLLDEQHPA